MIKEKIEVGTICILYLPTLEQIVDRLTKRLPKKQYDRLIDNSAMKDIFQPASRKVLEFLLFE